jgi:NADH-quinone oxidoreductase chain G
MLSIFINNKEITLSKRVSVLEACKKIGIEIPRYCYHENLSIAGNCRMCVVELKNSPKPLIACATPVINGMVIFTDSPLVKKSRESTLEFLLLNHPLDCPVCDQGGECDLQDQSLFFGSDKKRFYSIKRAVKDKNLGPIVKTVMTRCIHCTRCVRFAEEIAGVEVLGTFNRGMTTEIGTYVEKSFTSELSGNVVDLCPVGALTLKPYPFISRPWELKTLNTIDFTDGFGADVQVAVKNNIVVKVLSSFQSEKDDIWISDKTRFSFDSMFTASYIPINTKEGINTTGLNFWQNILKEIVYSLYFTEHLFSHNFQPLKFTVVYDSNSSLEVLNALLLLSKKYTFIQLRNLEPCNSDIDIESNFLTAQNYKSKINEADLIILVGFNSRYESSNLNVSLKKRYKKGSLTVVSIGPCFNATFPIESVGLNLKTVQNVVEGTHPLCQQMVLSNNPVIFLGSHFYKRNDAKILKILLNSLIKCSNLKNCTYDLIAPTVNQSGLSYLNLTKSLSLTDFSETSCAYFIDTNFSNGVISKLITSLIFYNSIKNNSRILIEQNTSFYETQDLVIDQFKKVYSTNIKLPSTNFFQQANTFINTTGCFKRSFKVVNSTKELKQSWKIVRGLHHFLKHFNSISYNKKYSNIVEFDSFNATQFSGYYYYPAINLNPFSKIKNINRCSFHLEIGNYDTPLSKFYNTNLTFLLDDFFIGGNDSYSKTSNIMVKCSKLLRQDFSNFKFIS